MHVDKRLGEIVGANEKTKIIVKLAKLNEGAPGREPVITEDAKRQMMLHAYRRQEELKVSASNRFILFSLDLFFGHVSVIQA